MSGGLTSVLNLITVQHCHFILLVSLSFFHSMSHPDSDDEDARSFASAQTAFDMPEDQKHDPEADAKTSDEQEHRLPPEQEKARRLTVPTPLDN